MFGDDAERIDLAAVVDVECVLDLQRGHPEVMDSLVRMHLEATTTLMEKLIVSVDREDLSGVVREAYRLRDLSESIGATAVAAVAGQLEWQPRRAELVFDLREAMAATHHALLTLSDE